MIEHAAAVSGAQLRSLLPHSGAMCLLDSVEHWTHETIDCRTNSHLSATNPLRQNGRLAALHTIEYAAQAAALHGGLIADEQAKTTRPALLAAVHDAQLLVARIDDLAGPLQVSAKRLFGSASGFIYHVSVRYDSQMIAAVRITVLGGPSEDS